jgi:hypothetical protein
MTSPASHIPMPGFTASPAVAGTAHFTAGATARFSAGEAAAYETGDTALERTEVRNGPASSFGSVFRDPSFKTPASTARAVVGHRCHVHPGRARAAWARDDVQKRMVKAVGPEKTGPRSGSFPAFRDATVRRQRDLRGDGPARGHAAQSAPVLVKTTARPAPRREGT